MFIAKNQVRMHDTDMAGILYFPRQFRFAHDALEDFVESEGLSFNEVFLKEKFVFVIAHAEADYLKPLKIGDKLDIHLHVKRIGTTSFTILYELFRVPENVLVGTAKTVHVTLDGKTREKISIPPELRSKLERHSIE